MRIGIDIGGMTVKIGLVEDYQIKARKVIATDSGGQTPEGQIGGIARAVRELLQENGIGQEQCELMGIACPGSVDVRRGIVTYANNIAWEDVDIVKFLAEDFDIPIRIANDADAAALGEILCGAAAGKSSAILMTLGTGVGGGVIMDKKIFSGFLEGGCELGHMVIETSGRPCTCGRKGCLEMYASASALMQDARKLAAAWPESLLNVLSGNDPSKINGKIIFDAQKRGDPAACQAVDAYEEYLSIGIANLINIFRPEIFILGGGVSAQKAYLTDELQSRVGRMCYGGTHGGIASIVTSSLGNDAGIIGAAYLQ